MRLDEADGTVCTRAVHEVPDPAPRSELPAGVREFGREARHSGEKSRPACTVDSEAYS